MSIRILYDQSTQLGKMLAQAVAEQINALQDLRRVKDILDKAQWGTPADWKAVALELGLVDRTNTDNSIYTKTQQAQDAWTIISTALAAVDVAAVNSELERLDQG